MINEGYIPGSFRDPSGVLFFKDGKIFRQINMIYKSNYDLLMNSGLYEALVNGDLLVPHFEISNKKPLPEDVYKIIQPKLIKFISYPYEWCFSQLKDAALITLKIQKMALSFGMSLKDCSAYNIQFVGNKPTLIDTLSFEKYQENRPWVAYKQFCQHFLAPLALTSYNYFNSNKLFRIHMDGIPIDLTSSLLPSRTYFRFFLLLHIHFHAKSQKQYAKKVIDKQKVKMSSRSILGLIDSLEKAVKKFRWKDTDSEWGRYYDDFNYSKIGFDHKKQILSNLMDRVKPNSLWDLGGNIGVFTRIANDKGIPSVSFDKDMAAVEKNYKQCVSDHHTNLLPLVLDLTNPSPNIGWENRERMSLIDRGPVDLALCLALIHHLCISNNVPFDRVAGFLQQICKFLIIEFVPKNDSQVKRLLATREDIFIDYKIEIFEKVFSRYFIVKSTTKIIESNRVLYLMKNRLS